MTAELPPPSDESADQSSGRAAEEASVDSSGDSKVDSAGASPDRSPEESPAFDASGLHAAAPPRVYSRGWAAVVAVVLLALLPLAWLGLRQIRLKNDVASWLPADDPNKIALDWFHDHFEPHDRMLVSWDTSSLDDDRVDRFADRVVEEVVPRSDPPVVAIESAVSPQRLIERMVDNQIDEATATQRLEGVLIGTGLLKVRLTDEGRRRRDAIAEDLAAQAAETFEFPVRIGVGPGDPAATGYDLELAWPGISPDGVRTDRVRRWLASQGDGRTDARVPLIDEVFFRAGSPVAVSVTVGDESEGQLRATIDSVRNAAEGVGVPPDELRMGGSPVAGAALNDNVLKAAWNRDAPLSLLPWRTPVGFSLLVGVLLAFVMLRSIRLAVLVLAVSIYTTVVTLALVPPTGGSMSMVLVVMPSLLLVLTMSGAIHVANYWRHAAHTFEQTHGERVPKGAAVLQAAKQAAVPCAMASLTTSIGLLSLMTSPLTPVRDFGLYSAIGCVISLGMVLVAFPALLRLWPGQATVSVSGGRDLWAAIGRWINRHGTLVAGVCLAVMLAGIAGLHKFRTETKVIRYFPDHSRIVQDYEFLEENLAGIVPVTVVVGFQGDGWANRDLHDQLDLVRRIETNLAAMPDVSGTLALPDFLPEDDPEMSRFKRTRVKRSIFDGVREAVEDPESNAGAAEFVTRVNRPLRVGNDGRAVRFDPPAAPDDPEDRQPLGQEIYKITAQVSILTDIDYGPFLAEVDQVLSGTIAQWEDEFAADEAEIDDDYADEEPAGERRVEYLVTGTVPLFLRTQEAVLESLIRSFGLAFAVIAVVMIGILRSPVAGLITMIPNLLPVGLVFGLVSWAEIPVDIGTMITASVALGVAVDGTLHLLTWFRERLGRGESAGDAIGAGLSHCGPAMFQTSTVVALGLLCLMFSDLLLISRFGWLMAALITAALVADLIFLPSLLSGKLGRVIERSVHGRTVGDTPNEADEPVKAKPETIEAA